MGFSLKKISLKGVVKGVGKLVKTAGSVASVVGSVVPGGSAVGNIATKLGGLTDKIGSSKVMNVANTLTTVELKNGKTANVTPKQAVQFVQSGSASPFGKNARTAKGGSDFLDYVKTAAGGAASAIGVKLAGEDEAQAAANAALDAGAKSAITTWIKNNVVTVVAAVALVVGAIWYSKRGRSKRKPW